MPELIGPGPIGLPGSTSITFTTPFPLRLGSRAVGTDGSEYVFCDFTGTVYGRQPVLIGSDYTAAAIGTTSARGPVGIACTGATSDNAGWVQIYGRCMMMLGGSGVSPSDDANGPTTLSTTAQTRFVLATSATSPNSIKAVSDITSITSGVFVEGITVATDASVSNSVSGTTSATSHTGNEVAVFLNYPVAVHRNFGE